MFKVNGSRWNEQLRQETIRHQETQALLDRELDHNTTRKIVIDMFNTRLLALEAHMHSMIGIQSASLEQLREISSKAGRAASPADSLTERERRMLDISRSRD